jgi:hypothetical protein
MGFAKVIFAVVVIGAICALVAAVFLYPVDVDSALTAVGLAPMMGGRRLGYGVAGVEPPTLAQRLESASAQHQVNPTQEVLMTGTPSPNGCLGGDKELMVEIQNDIDADQLDISYAFETAPDETTRKVKIASCGKQSMIKNCVPIPSEGRALRLFVQAFFQEITEQNPEVDGDGMVRVPEKRTREENRKHALIEQATEGKIQLLASAFE